ncbi:glycosyl hydrolase, family 16 [Arcticibacter svalbardensis MN12-7]|uniref:Glycosyl hydrolase, family 16 n=1 Tax=Arcticibacter svalbardensis MN12-7 TaxID=1150600 RepID=R9GV91_9SPHI|nr:hypothetical protein [Arcticibacter svalbardensis]EOR95445.1 glycosyl hydrolase, family 16 [Arcticibacter svalbardensis MN12-7]
MKITINVILLSCLTAIITFTGCKKQDYSLNKLVTPTDLNLSTEIAGQDTGNPNGNGTGTITIAATASNAMSYKIDFGDGKWQMVPEGLINYKYNTPGTSDYTVMVTAIGTGGITTTTSKKITVLVNFSIPPEMMLNLTKGTSQTWVTDRESPGHVGVGPVGTYTPDYYAATPNQRAECLYDDEITFTKAGENSVSLSVNNKGSSFLTADATAYYGKSGGDDCYPIDLNTPRNLTFMDATSGSTSANSTRIQFVVPGNGLINFGTGGTNYEILSLTSTTITLRNIGLDGLAWYQKLKVKP